MILSCIKPQTTNDICKPLKHAKKLNTVFMLKTSDLSCCSLLAVVINGSVLLLPNVNSSRKYMKGFFLSTSL